MLTESQTLSPLLRLRCLRGVIFHLFFLFAPLTYFLYRKNSHFTNVHIGWPEHFTLKNIQHLYDNRFLSVLFSSQSFFFLALLHSPERNPCLKKKCEVNLVSSNVFQTTHEFVLFFILFLFLALQVEHRWVSFTMAELILFHNYISQMRKVKNERKKNVFVPSKTSQDSVNSIFVSNLSKR